MTVLAGTFLCLAPFFHDGDNIRCGGREMRLARIEAPDFERSPKCRKPRPDAICDDRLATRSRDHLRGLARGKKVTCEVVDASPRWRGFQATDRYGRPVVRCSAGGVDLGGAQIAAGHARVWG